MSTDTLTTDPSSDSGGPNYQVRALVRGLAVLRSFRVDEPELTLTDLARRLGFAKSTLSRLLQALEGEGFIEQDATTGRWRLGVAAFEVGSVYMRQLSFSTAAQPVLERLANDCGETTSLGILADGGVVYLSIVHGQREIGIQSAAGARHPVHCTALGKALLAYRPEGEVCEILAQHPMTRRTDHTITTVPAFLDELVRVRSCGYAIDDEERAENIRCAAAPIYDHRGVVVAAISASGPVFRLDHSALHALARHVADAAVAISRQLGFDQACERVGTT